MANNIYFLQSNSVEVFPSGFRGPTYIQSKLTTEEYIRELRTISCHSENNNFFFIDPYDTNYFLLSIRGYLFKLNMSDLTSLLTNDDNIWAYIKLRDVSFVGLVLDNCSSEMGTQLDTEIDDVDTFVGLAFSNSDPTQFESPVDSENVLKIKNNGNYTYQYLRLSTDEIRNGYISNESADLPPAISEKFTTEKLNVETTTIDSNGIVSDSLKITSNLPNFEVSLKNGTVKANNVGTFADPIGSIYSSSISSTNLSVLNELLGNKATFTTSVITNQLGSTTSKVNDAYINNININNINNQDNPAQHVYTTYLYSQHVNTNDIHTTYVETNFIETSDMQSLQTLSTGVYYVAFKYSNRGTYNCLLNVDTSNNGSQRYILAANSASVTASGYVGPIVTKIEFIDVDCISGVLTATYHTSDDYSGSTESCTIVHCKKLFGEH